MRLHVHCEYPPAGTDARTQPTRSRAAAITNPEAAPARVDPDEHPRAGLLLCRPVLMPKLGWIQVEGLFFSTNPVGGSVRCGQRLRPSSGNTWSRCGTGARDSMRWYVRAGHVIPNRIR